MYRDFAFTFCTLPLLVTHRFVMSPPTPYAADGTSVFHFLPGLCQCILGNWCYCFVIFLSSLGMFVVKCNMNMDSSLWSVEGQGNFLSMLLHFCMKVRGRIFYLIVCLQPADLQGVLCSL